MDNNISEERGAQASIFEEDQLAAYDREQYELGVRKARNSLFWAGGLMFVVDMAILLIQLNGLSSAEINYAFFYGLVAIELAMLAAFVGLGFWTKKKPYSSILAGLILFCLIQAFAMISDPTNIYKGIIVKIVIIVSLVSGLKKAKALQTLNRYPGG